MYEMVKVAYRKKVDVSTTFAPMAISTSRQWCCKVSFSGMRALLRLMQGLALGGEWGGGVLLAVEYSPRKKRGFYGAVPQTGAVLAKFAILVLIVLFIQKRPQGLFAMKGRVID